MYEDDQMYTFVLLTSYLVLHITTWPDGKEKAETIFLKPPSEPQAMKTVKI